MSHRACMGLMTNICPATNHEHFDDPTSNNVCFNDHSDPYSKTVVLAVRQCHGERAGMPHGCSDIRADGLRHPQHHSLPLIEILSSCAPDRVGYTNLPH